MNCVRAVFKKISVYFEVQEHNTEKFAHGLRYFYEAGFNITTYLPIWATFLPTSVYLRRFCRGRFVSSTRQFNGVVNEVKSLGEPFALLCFGIGRDFYETDGTWPHAVAALRTSEGKFEVFDPIIYDKEEFSLVLKSDIESIIASDKLLIAAIINKG